MKELNPRERDALAMLRCGCSYEEAMRVSGLTFEQVERIWKEHGDKK